MKANRIADIYSALSAANIPYSVYSCNGCNVVGDEESIKKVMAAFHVASTVSQLRAYIVNFCKPNRISK